MQGKLRRFKLMLLSVLWLSIGFGQQGEVVDGVIAVLGNSIVLKSEYEQQRIQLIQQGVNMNSKSECQILEDLYFQGLLTNQAEIDSIEVSDNEVEAELENRLRYFEMQIGGREELEKFYSKSILEIKEEFKDVIRDKLLADRMRQKITAEVQVTPRDVEEFYKKIPKDSLPLVNSQVEIAQIVIKPEIGVNEKNETKNKLNQIRQDIVEGKKFFATEALTGSDDPGSKARGGEFDWVSRGTFVPEFDAVAFVMQKGSISEVFETEYGFHILELYERRGERYRGRHILKVPKVGIKELMACKTKLDTVLNEISTGKYTFEQAVAKYSMDEDTKNGNGVFYNVNTGESRISMNELDPQLFPAIDPLEVGDVSKPNYFKEKGGAEAYRIVKLLTRTKPHKANLDDDYFMIQNIAKQERQGEAIKQWVNRKKASTYVRINDEYRSCDYEFDWVSN